MKTQFIKLVIFSLILVSCSEDSNEDTPPTIIEKGTKLVKQISPEEDVILFHYNDTGYVYKITSKNNTETIFEYNGDIITNKSYYTDGVLTYKETYSFENGLYRYRTDHKTGTNYTTTYKFIYNQNNELTQTELYTNNNLDLLINYTITNNNFLKIEIVQDGQIVKTTENKFNDKYDRFANTFPRNYNKMLGFSLNSIIETNGKTYTYDYNIDNFPTKVYDNGNLVVTYEYK